MIYATALIILAYTCDPTLTALFTPPRPTLGRYEVCTSDDSLERSQPDEVRFGPVEQLDIFEAFGAAGAYDRARLAQLYSGRRVQVRRGWKREGARFESLTLLSPYPDASLSTLHEGTMLIRFTIDTSDDKANRGARGDR